MWYPGVPSYRNPMCSGIRKLHDTVSITIRPYGSLFFFIPQIPISQVPSALRKFPALILNNFAPAIITKFSSLNNHHASHYSMGWLELGWSVWAVPLMDVLYRQMARVLSMLTSFITKQKAEDKRTVVETPISWGTVQDEKVEKGTLGVFSNNRKIPSLQLICLNYFSPS